MRQAHQSNTAPSARARPFTLIVDQMQIFCSLALAMPLTSSACDGVANCEDGSDESGCGPVSSATAAAPEAAGVAPAAVDAPTAPFSGAVPVSMPEASAAPPAPATSVPATAVPVAAPAGAAGTAVGVPIGTGGVPPTLPAAGTTERPKLLAGPLVKVPPDGGDPNWGCGLLGDIPGITQDGRVTAETQRMIDALKGSSSFNKVSFWNWNLAPMTEKSFGTEHKEHLSSEFIFMPEQWGAQVVEDKYLRPAGQPNFLDSSGNPCPAEMATILLGSNEPDIAGSCMGNMFGKCSRACSDAEVAAGDCPAAYLDKDLPPALPNSHGGCNCWEFSHATGVGYWPFKGCAGIQPLPQMWNDAQCVDVVMDAWKKTAAIAVAKGYRYLTTPLVAVDIDYAKRFIEKACGCSGGQCSCTEAACGCPVYVVFHFYAYDCSPKGSGGYANLQRRLDGVKAIMDRYKFVKGAIINEIGMLNCAPTDKDPICVPNSGNYPAAKVAGNSCPATKDLPKGLATFIEGIFDLVIAAKTSDGKPVVKGVSWFNANMDGGTYNLQLFSRNGSINANGEAYMQGCTRWGKATGASKQSRSS